MLMVQDIIRFQVGTLFNEDEGPSTIRVYYLCWLHPVTQS